MDNRENLIELILNTNLGMCIGRRMEAETIVDNLIANGVTLDNQVSSSKWISVKDRLPKNRQDVLVVAFLRDCWNVCLGWYAPNGKVWHVGLLEETCYPVSHWMPLPEPPKGE